MALGISARIPLEGGGRRIIFPEGFPRPNRSRVFQNRPNRRNGSEFRAKNALSSISLVPQTA